MIWDIDTVVRGQDGIDSGTRERVDGVGVMYRCNRCKSAKRVERRVRVVRQYIRAHNHATGYAYQDVSSFRKPMGDWTPPECCGRQMLGNEIRGVFNADVACSAKCQGAVGPQCECSCGGKNHGRNHA